MLKQAFNKQADNQTQAILREKTREHDFEAHNHTLKGHAFVIPKNAAVGVADGGKLAFKKDEKFRKIFDRIIRMQEIMADIKASFERMNDILDKMKEETEGLEKITEFLRDDDMEGAKEYAESLGVDTNGWEEDQTREWLIKKGYEHIDNIEELTEQWKIEAKNIKTNIEKLETNDASPEAIKAAKDKLNGLEDKFEKVAEHKGLEEEFNSYALKEVNSTYELSKEAMYEISENKVNIDVKDINELKNKIAQTTNTEKLAKESLSTSQAPSLSKMEKFLKPKFNEVAPNTVAASLEGKKEPLNHYTDDNNFADNSKIEDMDSQLGAMSTTLKLG